MKQCDSPVSPQFIQRVTGIDGCKVENGAGDDEQKEEWVFEWKCVDGVGSDDEEDGPEYPADLDEYGDPESLFGDGDEGEE